MALEPKAGTKALRRGDQSKWEEARYDMTNLLLKLHYLIAYFNIINVGGLLPTNITNEYHKINGNAIIHESSVNKAFPHECHRDSLFIIPLPNSYFFICEKNALEYSTQRHLILKLRIIFK